MTSSTEAKDKYTVLPESFGKGPHGLGDPDDRGLRKVEMEVLIPMRMRDIAKAKKCVPVVKEFETCCKAAGLMMPFKCRTETKALRSCLTQWYEDKGFRQEVTEMYLEERSEYRRTGIGKKKRNNKLPAST